MPRSPSAFWCSYAPSWRMRQGTTRKHRGEVRACYAALWTRSHRAAGRASENRADAVKTTISRDVWPTDGAIEPGLRRLVLSVMWRLMPGSLALCHLSGPGGPACRTATITCSRLLPPRSRLSGYVAKLLALEGWPRPAKADAVTRRAKIAKQLEPRRDAMVKTVVE